MNSFILSVIARAHQQFYKLQDLRTGQIHLFQTAKDVLDYVENSSAGLPP